MWTTSSTYGNCLVNINLKLKSLKTDLKEWNLEIFNKTKVKKQQVDSEIEDIDKKDDESPLDEELIVRRLALLSELKGMEDKEMEMIKQKSQIQWAKKGDTNSNFFHSTLRWRKMTNDMVGLNIDGL